MAFLYIREHSAQGRDIASYQQQGVPLYPSVAEQAVAIAVGSTQSATLNANTTIVWLCADTVCSIAVGANPTAAATNWRIPANVPVVIAVPANSGFKIANIVNT